MPGVSEEPLALLRSQRLNGGIDVIDEVVICQLVPVLPKLCLKDVVGELDAPEVAGILRAVHRDVSTAFDERARRCFGARSGCRTGGRD